MIWSYMIHLFVGILTWSWGSLIFRRPDLFVCRVFFLILTWSLSHPSGADLPIGFDQIGGWVRCQRCQQPQETTSTLVSLCRGISNILSPSSYNLYGPPGLICCFFPLCACTSYMAKESLGRLFPPLGDVALRHPLPSPPKSWFLWGDAVEVGTCRQGRQY